jgi:hypothetical protein
LFSMPDGYGPSLYSAVVDLAVETNIIFHRPCLLCSKGNECLFVIQNLTRKHRLSASQEPSCFQKIKLPSMIPIRNQPTLSGDRVCWPQSCGSLHRWSRTSIKEYVQQEKGCNQIVGQVEFCSSNTGACDGDNEDGRMRGQCARLTHRLLSLVRSTTQFRIPSSGSS